jgi:5'-3' exonuclease
MRSLLALLREEKVTHIAAAFDHEVESFRNQLFDGYKTGEGIEPELFAQFPLVERAAYAMGFTVWPMTDFEADDALATAAAEWWDHPDVEQVVICSPDKDMGQCVRGDKVVMLDRRKKKWINDAGVIEKFGVPPESIPDWLALVGDAADGIPGIPRWGAKGAAAVLSRYLHIEEIPRDPVSWKVDVRGKASLAENLNSMRAEAELYRTLATLRLDVPLPETLDELRWKGARRGELEDLAAELGDVGILERVPEWMP